MQQARFRTGQRKEDLRRRPAELLAKLPLDPGDPDIARAKQLQRGMQA